MLRSQEVIYLQGPSCANDTVTFIVDTSEKHFIVHKSLACSVSPVLKAAFSNVMYAETRTKTYKMPHVSKQVFGYFAQWLYQPHREIFTEYQYTLDALLKTTLPLLPSPLLDNSHAQGDTIIQLWLLAQELQVSALQNYLTWYMLKQYEWLQDNGILTHVNYAFGTTLEGSPLRRYMFVVAAAMDKGKDPTSENSSPEFLRELFTFVRSHMDKAEITFRDEFWVAEVAVAK